MRKKLLTIQIVQTTFIIIILLVAILQKSSIIQIEKSFMGFYIISCLIYWIILMTIACIIMNKNPKKEKKILKVCLVLSIEILLLAIFCCSVDDRVDMLEFTKYCKETTAIVYNIDKRTSSYLSGTGEYERHEGRVNYIYDVEYFAEGSRYTAYFSEIHRGSGSSSTDAEFSAERHKPKYKIGDEFTIYYNTENPEDWRRDIGYFPDNVLNIFAFIIIGLRGFILSKSIRNYRKQECLD